MSDWPRLLPVGHWHPSINIWSILLGPFGHGRFGAGASTTWTAANRAIYVPVYIPETMVVKQLWHRAGTVAADNIDMGLYDIGYTRLVSSGPVAQSSPLLPQMFDVADTLVAPGIYYIGVSLSGTTGTAVTSASNGRLPGMVGIVMQESAHPLPATMNPITMGAVAALPTVGLTDRTVF